MVEAYDAVNFIAHGVAKDPSYGEPRQVTGTPEFDDEATDATNPFREQVATVDLRRPLGEGSTNATKDRG